MALTSPTTPEAERVKPYWGLGDVAAGFAIGLVASTIAATIAVSAGDYEKLTDAPMWVFALLQLPLWFGLAGAPLYAATVKGCGLAEDFGARMRPIDVPVGLAIGVVTQLTLVPIISWPWLKLLGKDSHDLEDRARDITDRAHGGGVVLLVLVIVIAAPFVEELFFRGLTLRSFERRFGSTPAIAASAVIFGLSHFDGLGLPALVLFGAIVGTLAVRTGRLGPGIWAHVGFNLTTVVALLHNR